MQAAPPHVVKACKAKYTNKVTFQQIHALTASPEKIKGEQMPALSH
jgi:hypothetical protein